MSETLTARPLRGVPWTTKELATLRNLAGQEPVDAIARLLGRSVSSVRQAAHRARVSLRAEGCTSGLVLGQPRDQSWKTGRNLAVKVAVLKEIRRGVLDGTVDMARLERITRRALLLAQGTPLCPACISRPQEVKRTGLCDNCHLRELARAHREDHDFKEAVREYTREKQRAHRRRKSEPTQEAS